MLNRENAGLKRKIGFSIVKSRFRAFKSVLERKVYVLKCHLI